MLKLQNYKTQMSVFLSFMENMPHKYLDRKCVKKIMFSIVLFACSLMLGVKASCPDNGPGWIEIGDSCYLVSNDSISWYEAQEV